MEYNITSHSYNYNTTVKHVVNIISNRELLIFQIVNYYVISSLVGLLGIVANIMNITVFYKHGFANTMNISFFGLAVSDVCGLITLLWSNIVLSGLLDMAGFSMEPVGVAYLTGGHTRVCFARITSWITVFITAERCLCITVPLKIKQLITPRRTKVILCSIFVLMILSTQPEYLTAYLCWRFDVNRNKTILMMMFTNRRETVEGLTFILYASLGFASFIIVIIFTLILLTELKRKSDWRQMATMDVSRSERTFKRERKTMAMVVMIASVLIVCYAPSVILSSVTFLESDFSVRGRYSNAFFALWSFVYVFEAVNSTVNIFLYYSMSSKYRATFHLVFGIRKRKPNSRSTIKQVNGETLLL